MVTAVLCKNLPQSVSSKSASTTTRLQGTSQTFETGFGIAGWPYRMGMKDHESGPNKYAKALCQHMATLWVAIKLVGRLDLLVLLQ